jgi:predicted NAD-dependent protein-ADP-ribosyltransferase YbiA (DUF1768 family)
MERPYGARGDVLFNMPDEMNGDLSNMTRTRIKLGGLEYPSPEHAFQASRLLQAILEERLAPLWHRDSNVHLQFR